MSAVLNAPWKAFKADGKHVTDDDWIVEHAGSGSTEWAPIKNACGVTLALAVSHSKSFSDRSDIVPVCRLIAAAPDLLAALEEARQGLAWYQETHPESADGSDDEAMTRIDAAIAKATGSAS